MCVDAFLVICERNALFLKRSAADMYGAKPPCFEAYEDEGGGVISSPLNEDDRPRSAARNGIGVRKGCSATLEGARRGRK